MQNSRKNKTVFMPLAKTYLNTVAHEKSKIGFEDSDYSCYSEDGYTDAASPSKQYSNENIDLELKCSDINVAVLKWQSKISNTHASHI